MCYISISRSLFCLASVCWAGASSPPHIIIFLADDLGWYNVGFHNKDQKSTPFTDKLVKEGAELTRHYAFSWCSPSRSALMSGRLPIHVNVHNPGENTRDPKYGIGGVDLRMALLPQKLKEAGYATAMVGKWHIGMHQVSNLPIKRGFDKFFGLLGGCTKHFDQVDPTCGAVDLWRDDKPAIGEDGKHYSCELYAGEAVKTIHAHTPSVPLFYFISMQTPHAPYECPSKYEDPSISNSDRRVMDCMMACTDEATKKITEALKAKGMWENTFLLWTSDNGAAQFENGNNYPLRGGKANFFEGGVRMASFVAGGAVQLPPGSEVNALMHMADWYATFCSLAGVDPSDDVDGLPAIDSMDLSALFRNLNAQGPRTEVALSKSAYIDGDLKIVEPVKQQGSCDDHDCGYWTGEKWPTDDSRTPLERSKPCPQGFCLFNLSADPSEKTDLAGKRPADLKRIKKKLDKVMQSSFQTEYIDPAENDCTTFAKYAAGHNNFVGPVCSAPTAQLRRIHNIRR